MDETNTERLEIAKNLIKNEKFEEAIVILEVLYDSNPDSEIIKRIYIDALFKYGIYLNDEYVLEYSKAIQYFKRIIDIDPNNYRAHYNLGIAYFNTNNLEQALKSCNFALKIKPDYKHCFYNIGLIYEARNQLKAALKYYQKALDIDPNFTYAQQAINDLKQRVDLHEFFESK
ncbi:MAG: tetratricopeptide repeat protein [Candidatus Hodarchaeota archaeon]